MLLLMKEPDDAAPPPELALTVPCGQAVAFPAERGQLLTVTDLDGGRPASLFAWTLGDPAEFLSPHHTRVFSNSYILTLGMRLMTNRRRPMLVLGRDTVGRHDLLMPASDGASLAEAGLGSDGGCIEAVRAAVGRTDLRPPKWPDPVNLFVDVAVCTDGSLVVGPPPSRPGDHVTCRILIDSRFVVAACTTGIMAGESHGSLAVRVANHL